jgi:hypothetical protein
MDAPRWIGEHFQHIIFGARVRIIGLERVPLRPFLLPFTFRFARVVAFRRHEKINALGWRAFKALRLLRMLGKEHDFQAGVNLCGPL